MIYFVGTPIGNSADITLRALEILRDCDYIFCEDTRQTYKLVLKYEITKPKLLTYNDHNTGYNPDKITAIAKMAKVAVVSDAGMLGISDPGYSLLEECIKTQTPYEIIPGVSSLSYAITGLNFEGMTQFTAITFIAFIDKIKIKELERSSPMNQVVIFYDNPRSLSRTIKTLHSKFGNLEINIFREATKKFETILRGTLSDYTTAEFKGEVTCAIFFKPHQKTPEDEVAQNIENILSEYPFLLECPTKDASNLVAKCLSCSPKEVYKILINKK